MKAAAPTHSPARAWLAGLLIVGAVIFAYQPAWHAGFIWDDDFYVTENPLLTAPDGVQRMWFSTDSPSQYFPLVYTTFRLEHALWGFNPTGYHWVNILLHAANALLVWGLLRRLAVRGAWLMAAIFALHPVQVESVAWVTELKNVQSLFFSLLALSAWLRFAEATPGGAAEEEREQARRAASMRWGWYGLAIVGQALALFSKTTACTLPAAMLLVLWLRHQPIGVRRLLQIVPFLAMGVAMGLVSMWWERQFQGTVGEVYSLGWLERLLVASRALCFYAGKLLWPANLTFNYPLWKIDAAAVSGYAWLALAAIAGVMIWRMRRAVGRGLETGVLFFVATLSPLLGFVMLYTFCYSFVTDHYVYVAMIGFVAIAVAGLLTVGDRLNAGAAVRALSAAVLLVTLGTLTWRQARMYRDLETLWRATLERNPESYMAHNNLATILLSRGDLGDAIGHLERALEIRPGHFNSLYNLGAAKRRAGDVEGAITAWQQAVTIQPNDAKVRADLGRALLDLGRVDAAIDALRRAVAIDGGQADYRTALGWALLRTGKQDEARAQFELAARRAPESGDTVYGLAVASFQSGRRTEAIAAFERAIALQPGNAEIWNNLGWAQAEEGRTAEAIENLQTALRLDPEGARVHANLAVAYADAGRFAEAAETVRQALQLADVKANPRLAEVFQAQLASALRGVPLRQPRAASTVAN